MARCNLLSNDFATKTLFLISILTIFFTPALSKRLKLKCDMSKGDVTWYENGKELSTEPSENSGYNISVRKDDSFLTIEKTIPDTVYHCYNALINKNMTEYVTGNYLFIHEVDGIVTGIFFLSALLSDVCIFWSFYKRSKKLKTLQIGFTSLAGTGFLFDGAWAIMLLLHHKIDDLSYQLLLGVSIFMGVSVFFSLVVLLVRREGCFYQPAKKKGQGTVALL